MRKEKRDRIIRVVLYIRVSTEEQALHGDSLEAQEAALVQYAKDHGYKIIKIYYDEGHSARIPVTKRNVMKELMRDAQEDMFDLILFTKIDRWFRSVREYHKIQEILDAHRIDWKTTLESYDTTTADGRLKINIMLSVAENESDRTSERIIFVNNNKVLKKEPVTGAQPWGYKTGLVDGQKRVVKNEKIEHIVADMFDHFLTYKSAHSTTSYLNKKYEINRSNVAVTKSLKNPAYTGEYRGVPDYRPAYITHEQHDEIVRTFSEGVNARKPRKKRIHLFTGLIRCPECGRKLSVHTTKVTRKKVSRIYYYYHCYSYCEKRCSYNKMVSDIKVETFLLNNISSKLDEYAMRIQVEQAEQQKGPKRDTKKYEERLKRVNNMYLMGNMEEEEYREISSELKATISEIKAKEKPAAKKKDIEELRKLIGDDFETMYRSLTIERRRALWTSIIDYIVVADNKPIDIIFL